MSTSTNSTTKNTKSSLNLTNEAELACAVTIEVKDLSSGGLTATFEIKFKFMEHEIEKEVLSTEAEAA